MNNTFMEAKDIMELKEINQKERFFINVKNSIKELENNNKTSLCISNYPDYIIEETITLLEERGFDCLQREIKDKEFLLFHG